MAAELKATSTPVIYSLNYPTRPRTLPPDADESLATLRARANAPKTPGALAKAGVTFAFETGGLAQPRDFVRNAARAVTEGLPSDAALRALTLDAAKIAGAADRVGLAGEGQDRQRHRHERRPVQRGHPHPLTCSSTAAW